MRSSADGTQQRHHKHLRAASRRVDTRVITVSRWKLHVVLWEELIFESEQGTPKWPHVLRQREHEVKHATNSLVQNLASHLEFVHGSRTKVCVTCTSPSTSKLICFDCSTWLCFNISFQHARASRFALGACSCAVLHVNSTEMHVAWRARQIGILILTF